MVLLALSMPFIFAALKENPTCFDGKQNQGETAPDLGGPCLKLDPKFVSPVKVLWSRALKLRPGMYNAVAMIENPNLNAMVKNIDYKMTFFDSKGVIVTERYGTTSIYPGEIFPIYEDSISTKFAEVSRVKFSFIENPIWIRADKYEKPKIVIKEKILGETLRGTRLETTLLNAGVKDVSDIYLVAVIYDSTGSALATSQSYLPYLLSGKESTLIFTWPLKFKNKAVSSIVYILTPVK